MRELSLHILDIVQNSLEAGATKVDLLVDENITLDLLTIRVSDNGRGMDEDTKNKAADPFVTTRRTRKVGLGIPLMAMTASQCGGNLTIESQLGSGTTVTATYRYKHWDRPPLGNMVDTIKSIVLANPDLDFSYTHIVNGKMFSLSTETLGNILGDIPLDHPEVITWLDGYLVYNLGNLYGGDGCEDD